MKRLSLLIAPFALAGLSSTALADTPISLDELNGLLDTADEHGFSHYDEISIDDSRLELEGWRDDGTRLEVDLDISDGSVAKERERDDDIPDWSLTGDEVRQALEAAQQEGLATFSDLEADKDGHIDVEGEDEDGQELEIRLSSSDFSVIKVERD